MEQYMCIPGYSGKEPAERFILGDGRTGADRKTTFIKRFMEQMVLPGITDENQKNRTPG